MWKDYQVSCMSPIFRHMISITAASHSYFCLTGHFWPKLAYLGHFFGKIRLRFGTFKRKCACYLFFKAYDTDHSSKELIFWPYRLMLDTDSG